MLKIATSDRSIADNIKVLYNKERDQKIVFFPMTHIGQKEYYESAREIIDSLRGDGYDFYYESVAFPRDNELDSVEVSTYNRKLRKILGFSPELDKKNKSLPRIYQKNNLVQQNYDSLGIYSRQTFRPAIKPDHRLNRKELSRNKAFGLRLKNPSE